MKRLKNLASGMAKGVQIFSRKGVSKLSVYHVAIRSKQEGFSMHIMKKNTKGCLLFLRL